MGGAFGMAKASHREAPNRRARALTPPAKTSNDNDKKEAERCHNSVRYNALDSIIMR